MTRPTTPAIMRMRPIVWISMPETVTSTAYLRIAPTAIRNIDAPIVMGWGCPPREACKLGPLSRPPGPALPQKPLEIAGNRVCGGKLALVRGILGRDLV